MYDYIDIHITTQKLLDKSDFFNRKIFLTEIIVGLKGRLIVEYNTHIQQFPNVKN